MGKIQSALLTLPVGDSLRTLSTPYLFTCQVSTNYPALAAISIETGARCSGKASPTPMKTVQACYCFVCNGLEGTGYMPELKSLGHCTFHAGK